jgi:hypothetical protein
MSGQVSANSRKKFWIVRNWALAQNPHDLPVDLIRALDAFDKELFSKWTEKIILPMFFPWILLIIAITIEILFLGLWKFYYPYADDKGVVFFVFLLFMLLQTAILHLPCHFITGLLTNIRTWKIFIAPSSMRKAKSPFKYLAFLLWTPGLKYELAAMLKASKFKRAVMLSAGVTFSYLLFYLNLFIFILFPVHGQPTWVTWLITIGMTSVLLLFVLTSWFWHGDFYKAKMIYQKRKDIKIKME